MIPLIPAELLLTILVYCDGQTIAACQQVCRQWHQLIDRYDALVWSPCCKRDFQKGIRRRFWSLDFPNPQRVNTAMLSSSSWSGMKHSPTLWKSLYRFTKCWSLGLCTATFLTDTSLHLEQKQQRLPCVVVGTTQEHHYFTTFSVTRSGHVVRSNPMYKGDIHGQQAMAVHTDVGYHDDPCASFFYLEDTDLHGIVCHYSDPTSHWIVTGGLDGTVSLWNESQRCITRTWKGHRGRVLCVSMNDKVVISGGSDSMIRVWDLDGAEQRGSIDISSYLSNQHDWLQGVGEIAVNGHLVVCAPDAIGPVLIFSLLTGSLVYELQTQPHTTAFTRLCLTPFYLLTRGEINSYNQDRVPLYPPSTTNNTRILSTSSISPGMASDPLTNILANKGTTHTDEPMPAAPPPSLALTPYQISQYYANQATATTIKRSCIDVWDLQTGKLVYRLVPPLPSTTTASITDIRISPNTAHVFACVEIRESGSRTNYLCCWDFSNNQMPLPSVKVIPPISPWPSSFGNAWACFY
ncbi:quinon protein alcohol dehydrogenase-like superfamily [Chlamydoabsidia padenii]|nr:quinon protein alcohol dehydrogenase-like superfamily [Chlamydoabsidia padenii]